MNVEISSHYSQFETAVIPFVNAMKIPSWREACRILFANKNHLLISQELDQIGLIYSHEPIEDIPKAADMLLAQASTNF